MYRIIGVFDETSHGVTGEYLIKLISANKLSPAAWGTYNKTVTELYDTANDNGTTDWTGAKKGVKTNANIILNEYYLNATDTSQTYGKCKYKTTVWNNTSYTNGDCSRIVGYGIKSNDTRNYIQDVTWYLYGNGESTANGMRALTRQQWYQCERNNYTNCKSGDNGTNATTTNEKIGLFYVSDYLYASGYIASDDNTTYDYSNTFMVNNWLYEGEEWTITPCGYGEGKAYGINNNGSASEGNNSQLSYGIRPSFYLKSNTKFISGTGTFDNPYIIG